MRRPTNRSTLDANDQADCCADGHVYDTANHASAHITRAPAQKLRWCMRAFCGQLIGVLTALQRNISAHHDLLNSLQLRVIVFSSAAASHSSALATLRRQTARLRAEVTELRAQIARTRCHIRTALLANGRFPVASTDAASSLLAELVGRAAMIAPATFDESLGIGDATARSYREP